jgi:hypothetical protein
MSGWYVVSTAVIAVEHPLKKRVFRVTGARLLNQTQVVHPAWRVLE